MHIRLCISLFIIILIFPLIAGAALTGTIEGRILDDTGQPLPGVQVSISGENLQGVRTVYSTTDGNFRAPLLPPGMYTLTAEFASMKSMERQNIEVSLNKTAKIDLLMQLAGLEEVMVVTADAPVLDTKSTTIGVNIDRSFTERLPQNDTFQEAFTMSGGTVGAGNPNIHGATNTDNAILFDGMDITDPVTHTFAQNLNADAIEEVEVQTGGFEAEYGKAMGGIVNAVTKTGGNDFSGIFRIKYMTDALNASAQAGRTAVNVEDNYEPTFSIGGPILKDKLWFFVSYRITRDTTSNDVRTGIDAEGDYTFASVKSNELWQYGHLNLTYQMNQNQNLQFSFTWDPADLQNYDQDSDYRYSPEAQAHREQGGERYGLNYSNILSPNFFINAKAGYFNSYIYIEPQSDSGLPSTYDRTNKIYYDNFDQIDTNDRERTMFTLSGTYYIENLLGGSHEIKSGVEYQQLKEDHFRDYTTGRYYETQNGQPYRYKEYVGPYKREKQNANYYAFYLQDAWEALPGLTIKPGLRFERAEYYNKENRLVHTFDAIISPRLGIAYDLHGDGQSKLYTFFGRYFKLDDLNITFGDPGPSVVHNIYLYNPDDPDADENGYVLQSSTGGEESSNLLDPDIKPEHTDEIILGYDRKIMDRFSVGVRGVYRRTANNWEDIGYYYDENGNVVRVDEINWDSADTDGDGVPDDAKNFWDQSRTVGGWMVTNPHNGYRQYLGVELSATAKTEKFLLEASYTFSETKGTSAGVSPEGQQYNTPFTGMYDDPYSSINLDGRLSYDSPHYLKVNGSYMLPWSFSVGVSAFYRSGYAYSQLLDQPDGMAGEPYLSSEGRGAYRMSDVTMFDLSLQKDFDFGRWGILTGIIDITNLFDNQVELDVDRQYFDDPNENRFGESVDWSDPRQVQFQLKYSF